MPNIDAIISGHNKKVKRKTDNEDETGPRTCNCRGGEQSCPMKGQCLQSSIIYKAAVRTTNKEIYYIGQAGNTFKERYNNHQSSMRLRKLENSTALSKCIWNLVDNGTEFKLSWLRIATAPTYKPSTERCNLCNFEKTLILFSREELLNSRSEILNKCRHRNKFLLAAVT